MGSRKTPVCRLAKLAAASLFAGLFIFTLPAKASVATEAEPDGFDVAARLGSPEFLRHQDLLNTSGFLTVLRQGQDSLSGHLRNACSANTLRLLSAYDVNQMPDPALVQAILNDLNYLIYTQNLYTRDRFAGITLRPSTLTRLQGNPQGTELVRLNRVLLEDAYPRFITPYNTQPFDVQADILDYDQEKGVVIATGNAIVRRDDEILRSDYALVNVASQDVIADGRVAFQRGNDIWVGDRLHYNFRSKHGDFGEFRAFLAPFYVHALSSRQIAVDEFLLEDVTFTTCEGEEPAVSLHAKKATIKINHSVRAYNVVMYAGNLPAFYFPFWFQNIGTRNFISLVPGYNSRMGLFLLTSLNYRLYHHLEATTHLDIRARRGFGIGQDFLWTSSGNARGLSTERYRSRKSYETDILSFARQDWRRDEIEADVDKWFGDLTAYYLNDSWPDEGKDQLYPLDQDRYRLRLYHSHTLADNNYLQLQLNYLSDPKVIQQFFREEYKTYPEPENYLVLGRHTQNYSLSFQIQKRLNDFYTVVDKVPELTLDIHRQEIGSSRIYYESENSAAYLKRLWEKNETQNSDYSSFRTHTSHKIHYPLRFFGFLNLNPRAGYQGTYYSRTKEDYQETITNLVEGLEGITTNITTSSLSRKMDADYRNVYELGFETSFKAFKVWQTHPGDFINNLRHIAEPYADYTYIPEPNLLPSQLYQFDDLDKLDRRNDVRIGMRNKLQTKRREIFDLIKADFWTYYRLDPEDDEEDFDNLFFDVRSKPYNWVELEIEGEYNHHESELESFNTRLTLSEHSFWSSSLEHRYSRDNNSLLNASVMINPYINWGFRAFTRYEFEDSELEAWGVAVRRTIDCVAVELGFEWEDDNYEIWAQLWFTEFPRGRVSVGL